MLLENYQVAFRLIKFNYYF